MLYPTNVRYGKCQVYLVSDDPGINDHVTYRVKNGQANFTADSLLSVGDPIEIGKEPFLVPAIVTGKVDVLPLKRKRRTKAEMKQASTQKRDTRVHNQTPL